MNLRISLLALGMLAVSCGSGLDGPRGAREPVLSCDGLSRTECAETSGCQVEELACIALCVDDGSGNCGSPCAEDFRCVAQPAVCESLNQQACEADARCEFVAYACAAVCLDDGQGGCLPCNAPPSSCRTRETTPVSCYGLTPDACDAHPECEFVARDTCACITAPCDCPVIEPSCQPRQTPPVSCYGLSPDACDAHPECEFVSRYACDCPPGAACACPAYEPSCQPREPTPEPLPCYGLSPNECDAHPECEFVSRDACACAPGALCDCPVIEPSCQPRLDPCTQYSADVCVNVPGCGLLESDCGCPEGAACDCALVATCVTVSQPDPCAALDVATCTTDSRCELVQLDCAAVCIDDGQGGCVPCPATQVCQQHSEPPIAGCGGGGAPPSP